MSETKKFIASMGVGVGDRIKDNDPRIGDRVLTVARIGGGFLWAYRAKGHREYRIKINRVYTDGKPRRSGFSKLATLTRATDEPGEPHG